MRHARRVLPALATAAALALSTAPVAHADTSAPRIRIDSSGAAPGYLRLFTTDGATPVGAVTARIFAPGVSPLTGTPAAVVDLHTAGRLADGETLWSSDHLPGLVRGTVYHAFLQLSDAGGNVLGEEQQVPFPYRSALRVTGLSASAAAADWLHQQVTVTGTLIEDTPEDPGPGAAVGAGYEVDVLPGAAGLLASTTDAAGHFSRSFTPTAASQQVTAFAAVPRTGAGADTPATAVAQPVTVRRSLTRISGPAGVTLREGSTAAVSGTAEIQTAQGTWVPLPRTPVLCPDGRPAAATDASGRYTCTLSITGNRTVTVSTGDTDPGDLWLATSSHRTTVRTVWKTATTLTATLDDRSRLHVTGTLRDSVTRRTWPSGAHVQLEYSANGTTGWQTIRTLTVSPGTKDAPTTGTFSTSFAARNDGYWRARFTGNTDNQPSTSPVRRAHRYATRITAFNASPEPVRKGRTLTVTGRLQKKTSSVWSAATGQTVTLYFTPRGSTHATRMGTARTDSHGTFTAHYTAKLDGTWTATWWTTSPNYLTATATPDYVDVN
ncbi:hypothetical protein [Peterkaempfera griseoplana]|uniref:hypothetical protein n=1 Tax=Peterkaempfera griseoplana TaxID=66896 RepID=UPI0006E1C4E8|nr:hypothetical protein [Peterkaempfera griseoplana]